MTNDFKKYSDRDLVLALRRKKKIADRAFAVLHDRYAPRIIAYLRCMMKDEEQIEDIYQEVFIRLYRKADPSLENFNLSSFLFTTARNLCFNNFRARKATASIEGIEESIPELIVDESEDCCKKQLFDLIIAAMDLLDEKSKEAFALRHFDGMKLREIAEICGISLEAAKKRVSRARSKIINMLEPYLKDLSK